MVNYEINCNKCDLSIVKYNGTEEDIKNEIQKIGDNHQGEYCDGKLNYTAINNNTKRKSEKQDDTTKHKKLFLEKGDYSGITTFNCRNFPYCYFPVVDSVDDGIENVHYEVRALTDSFVKRLAWIHTKTFGGDFKESTSFIENIRNEASHASPTIELYERISCTKENIKFPNVIYYDLCDDTWKTVKITKDGWSFDNPPIMFERHGNAQLPQVMPVKDVGVKGIYELRKIISLPNEDIFNLWLIHMCTMFVPHIQHPIAATFGPHDSAKTSLDWIRYSIVDPALGMDGLTLTGDRRNDTTVGQTHYLLSFGNVSSLSVQQQDFLCRLVTGDSFQIRKMWTDKGTTVFSYLRCVSINSVANIVSRSDLASRCILYELDPISNNKRIDQKDLELILQKIKPIVLGSIFDIISKAMNIVENISLKEKNRFGDFCVWGAAIAETIGYGKEKFIDFYLNKAKEAESLVSEGDIVISCVKRLMEGGTPGFFKSTLPKEKWEGTPEDLYGKLRDLFINYVPPDFPKTTNSLGKRIAYAKKTLLLDGIEVYKYATTITTEGNREKINKYIITNKNYKEPIKSEKEKEIDENRSKISDENIKLANETFGTVKSMQEITDDQHKTGFKEDGSPVNRKTI